MDILDTLILWIFILLGASILVMLAPFIIQAVIVAIVLFLHVAVVILIIAIIKIIFNID